jgi:membrane protein
MAQPRPRSAASQTAKSSSRTLGEAWRARYDGSFVQDLAKGLGAVDFGDRILVFGACLLLSVLPLIIVLSAFASHQIDDDIATHLGLSARGGHIVEGLFAASTTSVNFSVILGLLLSFAGTISVARSVEVIYERAFEHPPLARAQGWLRCTVWVVVVAGIAIGDTAAGRALRDGPAGPAVMAIMAITEMVGFTVFFWWSIHFLLAGREPWRRVRPAAIATAVFWVGLGAFAAFYFSSTIVDDSKTYGTIGVTFTLVSWFIAMGAVLTLGAVAGAVWARRRTATNNPPFVATEPASGEGEGQTPPVPQRSDSSPGRWR